MLTPPDARKSIVTNGNFGETWTKAELFFLRDALAHGMSSADVARYLRRTEDEVREKSKGMSRTRGLRASSRGREGDPLESDAMADG
jgi:hypothetical protein